MLREAEKLAGVEDVPGRRYHGVNARTLTLLIEAVGGAVGAVGLVTGNDEPSVLLRTYGQHEGGLRLEAIGDLEQQRVGG